MRQQQMRVGVGVGSCAWIKLMEIVVNNLTRIIRSLIALKEANKYVYKMSARSHIPAIIEYVTRLYRIQSLKGKLNKVE